MKRPTLGIKNPRDSRPTSPKEHLRDAGFFLQRVAERAAAHDTRGFFVSSRPFFFAPLPLVALPPLRSHAEVTFCLSMSMTGFFLLFTAARTAAICASASLSIFPRVAVESPLRSATMAW